MGKETSVLIMRESLQLRYMYTLCTVGTHCANQEQSKGNNSKQYSFDVNSVSNKVNKHHTSIGLTGVIKEALRSEERRVGKECRSRWSPYH